MLMAAYPAETGESLGEQAQRTAALRPGSRREEQVAVDNRGTEHAPNTLAADQQVRKVILPCGSSRRRR